MSGGNGIWRDRHDGCTAPARVQMLERDTAALLAEVREMRADLIEFKQAISHELSTWAESNRDLFKELIGLVKGTNG